MVVTQECDYYSEADPSRFGSWADPWRVSIRVGTETCFAKGRRVAEETRRHISNGLRGRRKSKQHRNSISRSSTGTSKSTIHRQKIASSLKGRTHTEAARGRMALAIGTRNIIIR